MMSTRPPSHNHISASSCSPETAAVVSHIPAPVFWCDSVINRCVSNGYEYKGKSLRAPLGRLPKGTFRFLQEEGVGIGIGDGEIGKEEDNVEALVLCQNTLRWRSLDVEELNVEGGDVEKIDFEAPNLEALGDTTQQQCGREPFLPIFTYTSRRQWDPFFYHAVDILSSSRIGLSRIRAKPESFIFRQLPEKITNEVDDKVGLWENIRSVSNLKRPFMGPKNRNVSAQHVMPESYTWDDIANLIQLQAKSKDEETAPAFWFIKHRYGVQGRAVHVVYGRLLHEVVAWFKRYFPDVGDIPDKVRETVEEKTQATDIVQNKLEEKGQEPTGTESQDSEHQKSKEKTDPKCRKNRRVSKQRANFIVQKGLVGRENRVPVISGSPTNAGIGKSEDTGKSEDMDVSTNTSEARNVPRYRDFVLRAHILVVFRRSPSRDRSTRIQAETYLHEDIIVLEQPDYAVFDETDDAGDDNDAGNTSSSTSSNIVVPLSDYLHPHTNEVRSDQLHIFVSNKSMKHQTSQLNAKPYLLRDAKFEAKVSQSHDKDGIQKDGIQKGMDGLQKEIIFKKILDIVARIHDAIHDRKWTRLLQRELKLSQKESETHRESNGDSEDARVDHLDDGDVIPLDDALPSDNLVPFHLFGYDFVVGRASESKPDPKLLEINACPALGWGTMSDVPKEIYDRLGISMVRVLFEDSQPHNKTDSCYSYDDDKTEYGEYQTRHGFYRCGSGDG